MIMTNRRSGVAGAKIRAQANLLRYKVVKVIPVAIGNEVDPKELEKATEDGENVITVPKNENSEKLGQKIMDKVVAGAYDNASMLIAIIKLQK